MNDKATRRDSALEQALAEETRTREALLFMLEDLEENRRAIEQAHRNWVETVDALGDPLMAHDREFRIVRANRAYAARAGLKFKDLIGRPYWECFPKGDGPLWTCRERTEEVAAVPPTGSATDEFTLDTGETFVSRAFANYDPGGTFLYALHLFEDVTERRRADKALRRLNRALRTLSAGNETLVRAADEQTLLREMCRVIADIGDYRVAWIGYCEEDPEKSVRTVACHGAEEAGTVYPAVTWADTELGQGPVGIAVRTGLPQLVRNLATDPRVAPWRAFTHKQQVACALALPLQFRVGASPFGALAIGSAEAEAFDDEEVELLKELAGDLAYGIETLRTREAHKQSAQRLLRSMEETIRAIAATVDLRDPYTAGHQRRVAQLAAAIAREMGLPDDRILGLHLGSVVHDLGKIRIPAEILSKPTRLTRVEYEIIKTHAQAGYAILKDVDFPWPIAEIVRQHHERLDGSGYPRGLKAGDILIEAKILAVADTVEAMGAARPYRPAVGIDAALKEIAARRGTQYDAAAVDACLRLFQEKGFAFAA